MIGFLLATLCLIIGGVIGGIVGTTSGITNGAATAIANDQANADLSATVGVPATATALTSQANATATAAQEIALPDPYPPTGTLALFDPLNQANQWQEMSDSNFGGSCAFINDGYEISQTVTDRFYTCTNANNLILQNFALEVTMTLSQGDCGGLTLRENSSNNHFYTFRVCSDATYQFWDYISNDGSTAIELTKGSTDVIHRGSVANIIAVVARNDAFDLYVNHKKSPV